MKALITRLTLLTLFTAGSAVPLFCQTTVYEQSRLSTGNNPDFTFNGFTGTVSANKSTAPGIPAIGSPGSRIASTSIAAGPGTNFVLSPNNTTAGQLAMGTTYAVAITFGSTGNNETSDLVVTTSDAGCNGNDTFAGTSSCFKNANGYNTWITVGNITVNSATPTITFAYLSGTTPRWYVDTIRFTPLPSPPTAQYWNTGSPGGSGTWNTTTANWNTSSTGSGTQGVYTQADLADFGGTAGVVSITPGGVTTDGGLEFDTTGYTIQGGPLTLGQGTNIAVVGGANIATMNSVITGTNGMATTGLGTLVLNNTNNFTGTVTVATGTLSLATNQTFTSLAGNLSGILELNTNTLTVGDSNNTTFSGDIADTGSSTPGYLIKQGSGVLALNGTSTFHGNTTVNAGALTIASDAALGTAPSSPVANQLILNNGGRLDFSASATLSANRGITLDAGGGTLSTPGTSVTPTIPCSISGSGSLTIPSGGFDFTGSNTFTGNMYLTGTNIDSGGNNLISLRLDATGATGAGKIFVSPVNPINITLRTFTATNVLVTNAMEFDSGGIFLSGAIASSKNCTITFSGNINGTNGATVGNPLAEESSPGGTVILSGSNSLWSGGVVLQVGTLGVGSPTALGTGALGIVPVDGSNVVLFATTPLTGANALTNPVAFNVGAGPFAFGGTNNIELAGPFAFYNTSSSITTGNTGLSIISGSITDSVPSSGDGIITAGPGTLIFSGSNTYDGVTTVSSGTLEVNNTTGSGTGSGAVSVSSGATLGGSGIISGTVDVSGTIAPGNGGPGTLTTADETWEGGASYTWDINKAGGTAGANPGWSQANITGGLNINATSGDPFTINITSLTLGNTPGTVSDFSNARNYTWSIAHTATGITNFTASAFTLNTSSFSNSLGSGSFSITNSSTDILLVFTTPVSAPTIGSIHVAGTNLTIAGSGGAPGGPYNVLASTNVTVNLTNWVQVGSSNFDGSGNFNFNGSISSTNRQLFYVIESP